MSVSVFAGLAAIFSQLQACHVDKYVSQKRDEGMCNVHKTKLKMKSSNYDRAAASKNMHWDGGGSNAGMGIDESKQAVVSQD